MLGTINKVLLSALFALVMCISICIAGNTPLEEIFKVVGARQDRDAFESLFDPFISAGTDSSQTPNRFRSSPASYPKGWPTSDAELQTAARWASRDGSVPGTSLVQTSLGSEVSGTGSVPRTYSDTAIHQQTEHPIYAPDALAGANHAPWQVSSRVEHIPTASSYGHGALRLGPQRVPYPPEPEMLWPVTDQHVVSPPSMSEAERVAILKNVADRFGTMKAIKGIRNIPVVHPYRGNQITKGLLTESFGDGNSLLRRATEDIFLVRARQGDKEPINTRLYGGMPVSNFKSYHLYVWQLVSHTPSSSTFRLVGVVESEVETRRSALASMPRFKVSRPDVRRLGSDSIVAGSVHDV